MTTNPYQELLTALEDYTVGEVFVADDWRHRADTAHLTSAQVSAAHRRAVKDGYLVRVTQRLPDGRRLAMATCSATPSRKSGHVRVYSRTSKALPNRPAPDEAQHERVECDGQTDLLELTEANA